MVNIEKSILKVNARFISVSASAENFKNKVSQVATVLQNGLAGAMSVGHIMSSMASGFSTIAMGISSVSNAIQTLQDEEASFTTKLTSGATAATMGISALMAVLKGFSSFIGSINIAIGISNGIKAVNNALTAQSVDLSTKEGKARAAELIVQKLNIAEDKKEAAMEEALNLLDKNDIKTTYEKVAADYANVASQAAKLWYITLIIAAVALLTAGIIALMNAESEEEAAMRKAVEVQKGMQEQLQETKQAANDIISAFDEYKSIEDKLKACTKGTKEWNDALIELQTKVLEILNKFPELSAQYANLYSRDAETGMLTFNSDVVDQIQSDYNLKMLQDTYKTTASTLMTSIQRVNNEMSNVFVDPDTLDSVDTSSKGYDSVGLHTGLREFMLEYKDKLVGLTEEEYKIKFQELYKKYSENDPVYVRRTDYDDSVSGTGDNTYDYTYYQIDDVIDDITDVAVEWKDTIDKMETANQNYVTALEQTTRAIIQTTVPDADELTTAIASAETNALTEKYKKAYFSLMTDNEAGDMSTDEAAELLGFTGDTGINIASEQGNDVYKFILEEFQKYGKQWFADSDNPVQGTDGARYLSFAADTDEGTVRKSAEWIAAELASSKALEEISDSVVKAENLLNKISDNIENANFGSDAEAQEIAFKTIMANKNLEGVSTNSIMSLYNAMDGLSVQNGEIVQGQGDGEITEEEVSAYLDKMLGNEKDGKISNKTAKTYNFDSAEDMVHTYYINLKSTGSSIIKMDALENSLGSDLMGQLTYSAAEALNTTMSKINLGPAGGATGYTFINGLKKAIEDVDIDQQAAALEKLAIIDWNSYDAIDQAKEAMSEYGVVIDTTSTYWVQFADKMRLATNAIPDYSKLKQELIKIQKIISSITYGSSIDEANYQKLLESNIVDWSKFFIMQADGTRKFIGNEEDMQEALRETIRLNQQKLATDAALAKAINDKNIDVNISDREAEIYAGGEGKDGKFNFSYAKENNTKGYQLLTAAGYTVEDDGTVKNFSGEKVSNDEASKIVMTASKAEQIENMVNDEENPEVKDALLKQGYKEEQIADIIEKAKIGQDTEFNRMVEGLETLVNQKYGDLATGFEEMMASTATSLINFDNLDKDSKFSDETKQKTLKSLASQYAECTDEVEAYNEALTSNDPEKIANAEDELRKAIRDSEWKAATKAVKDYMDEIEDLTDTEEIADKHKEIADTLNNTWGTNITSTFVKENYALFNEWANATGDRATELALELQSRAALASAAATDIIPSDIDLNSDGVIEECEKVENRFAAMKAIIEANPITVNLDGQADLTQLITALTTAGYTAQEVANYLASIGQTEIKFKGDTTPLDLTDETDLTSFLEKIANFDGSIAVTSANVPSKGIADMNNYTDSDSSSSSDTSTSKGAKKSDVIQRHKKTKDALDNVARATEKASEAADRLYGKDRLEAMQKVNESLTEEVELLGKKREEAEQYLAEDKSYLDETAKTYGLKFEYDSETGDITNYEEAMSGLYKQLEEVTPKVGQEISDSQQDIIDDVQEKINYVQAAVDAYDKTKESLEDIDDEIQEKMNEIQDINFSNLEGMVELQIEFNESDLKRIEYELGKIENDFYSQAEGMALTSEKLNAYTANLDTLKQQQTALEEMYAAGAISQADYAKGLKTVQESIYENLSSIDELKAAMEEYYTNTLNMASNEIAKYTDKMEHLTNVMDHYSNIMELAGKAWDYKSMGNIIKGQVDMSRNTLETSKNTYETWKEQSDFWASQMATAVQGSEEWELYNKNWEAAVDKAQEAEEQMLSDAETFLKNLRTQFENTLSQIGETLTKSLTGFSSTELLDLSLEGAQQSSENFLTNTNKIYETNKMITEAQKELDATTNKAAKTKLNSFIQQTKQLQKQDELSQTELDIQQAKYNLLLAQIALEDARNAKSSMTLKRDASGNYSYVYTADNDKIADAEQKVADEENALYNKRLEAANNFGEQIVSANKDYANQLKELQTTRATGEISEKEYLARLKQMNENYTNQIQDLYHLYGIATGEDANIAKESWVTAMVEQTASAEQATLSISQYLAKADAAYAKYQAGINEATNLINFDLKAAAQEVENVTTKHEELANTLKNTVIPAIESELDYVDQASITWGSHLTQLGLVSDEYETLAEKVGGIRTAFQNLDGMELTYEVPVVDEETGDISYDTKTIKTSVTMPSTMATGGYTGEWGPDGRWAVLHQKELVLNATDTENILAAVSVVRELDSYLDGIVKAMISSLSYAASAFNSSVAHNEKTTTLQQEVNIHAEFPAAESAAEIRTALETLTLDASQYINIM